MFDLFNVYHADEILIIVLVYSVLEIWDYFQIRLDYYVQGSNKAQISYAFE